VQLADLVVLAVIVFAYGLVSRRLETTPITGPIVFVGAGLALGAFDVVGFEEGMAAGAVRVLAEATLVLVLFTDAIRIDLARLRPQAKLPGRLLGIGLPLTIVLGTAVAMLLLPQFGVWEAALVAAILTPTDAALGQAVVKSPRVPVRIRQGLNVESGLNDGLMLPVITILLALAASEVDAGGPGSWVGFAAAQIGFGLLVGAVVGAGGGLLLRAFAARGWVEGALRQLATLGVGVTAYGCAELAEGNGFVAAFVAGVAFGAAAREQSGGAYEFAEDEGVLLTLLTFLFFGAELAQPALGALTWRVGLYVIASLSFIRMVPVALSLIGLRLRMPTIAFLGWFGPRGLASIVFGLFVLEEADLPAIDDLLLVVTWTVMASVLLHGATAFHLSERYGDWFSAHGDPEMAEAVDVEMMATR
jgi:NhaP-type Na+/H+ or K+/H+ antiporter